MRRWVWLLLAALGTLLLLAIVAFLWQSVRLLRTETRPIGLVELSKRTGIAFPKSAAVGRSRLVAYVTGRRIWAEITIPTADMSRFASVAVPGQVLQFDAEYQPQGAAAAGAPSWWPQSRQFPGTAVELRHDNWAELLLDEVDSQTTTVCLYWHSG